ncbi:MAG: hypothetical protein M3R51_06085 [Candidatus Eremiobacteraeota bacterium]|nr:hypothetical protein [Candidatus Eremiobacteraeota bacterium]
MRSVYIGVAVLIVAIIAIFWFLHWQQDRAMTAAVSTPTPAPVPSGQATKPPIQLADGGTLGKPYFKTSKEGSDTAQGGKGQPVDGISCAGEYATLHVHSHLSIFDNGVQLQVPQLIGGTPTTSGGCLYWIHTHDASGIIHVESPVLAPEGQSGFTLGNFFDIWGQPLTNGNVGGIKGPVTAFVNGVRYDGDLKAIPLGAHQQIVLEIGKTVRAPNYEFPPND